MDKPTPEHVFPEGTVDCGEPTLEQVHPERTVVCGGPALEQKKRERRKEQQRVTLSLGKGEKMFSLSVQMFV